jgi:hypothetical protein
MECNGTSMPQAVLQYMLATCFSLRFPRAVLHVTAIGVPCAALRAATGAVAPALLGGAAAPHLTGDAAASAGIGTGGGKGTCLHAGMSTAGTELLAGIVSGNAAGTGTERDLLRRRGVLLRVLSRGVSLGALGMRGGSLQSQSWMRGLMLGIGRQALSGMRRMTGRRAPCVSHLLTEGPWTLGMMTLRRVNISEGPLKLAKYKHMCVMGSAAGLAICVCLALTTAWNCSI